MSGPRRRRTPCRPDPARGGRRTDRGGGTGALRRRGAARSRGRAPRHTGPARRRRRSEGRLRARRAHAAGGGDAAAGAGDGRDAGVPRAARTRPAADAARTAEAVPVLYAVEALRGAGAEGRATRALRDADGVLRGGCGRVEPMQRAALTLLRGRVTDETRACLRSALGDRDTQTRWLVRRALALDPSSTSAPRSSSGAAGSPVPPPSLADVRPDGLVAKSPAQLGTLTATYHAARALTAAGRRGDVPGWLTKRLKELGSDPRLDPSDRVPLAMTCHR